jgi:hypothetical protein
VVEMGNDEVEIGERRLLLNVGNISIMNIGGQGQVVYGIGIII